MEPTVEALLAHVAALEERIRGYEAENQRVARILQTPIRTWIRGTVYSDMTFQDAASVAAFNGGQYIHDYKTGVTLTIGERTNDAED